MPYADTDFFLALAKDDDWLGSRALDLLSEHEGELRTSLATFIEIAYNAQAYEIDLEQAGAMVLELADVDVPERWIFQAYAYIEAGLGVMDAFQAAAAAGDRLISSDQAFDDLPIDRIPLEPNEAN